MKIFQLNTFIEMDFLLIAKICIYCVYDNEATIRSIFSSPNYHDSLPNETFMFIYDEIAFTFTSSSSEAKWLNLQRERENDENRDRISSSSIAPFSQGRAPQLLRGYGALL